MDQVHVIRHKHFTEGQSARRIAREMGLHRGTVRKYLEQSEPVRAESEPRPQPVMGAVGPRIEALLEAWAPRLGGKHRLTSTRLHRQLVEDGCKVGERTVREYLAERRRRAAEVYIPLVHRAGDEAQVDFFEVLVDCGGQRRKAWKFLLRQMYSGRDFVWLYDRCDGVSFLDGHVRAFSRLGGVSRRAVYDNLSAAVKRIVGLKERQLTGRFQALVSHYRFEPCFARPCEGHDKGGVEGRGKTIRLQHLTPIVAGPDLDAISAGVLGEVERHWATGRDAAGRTGAERFEEERGVLLPLPATAFEARRMVPVSVGRGATVRVERAEYSVPERWARLEAEAWIGARDIRLRCRGETVIRPRQLPGGRHIEYRDYLGELSRKPQAVRQVAPELVAELGEPYGRLWALLARTHGERQGARLLAGVLGAVVDHGEEAVSKALAEAMAGGEVPVNLLALARALPAQPHLAEAHVPAELRGVEIQMGRAADYDALLAEVVS